MADPERARAVIERLGEMGLELAIDDFGTGYSSLALLRRLPVHAIKIDRSFVMGMASSHSDAVIVRSTVELARNLGMQSVAEGVDTVAAWRELQALGLRPGAGPPVRRGDGRRRGGGLDRAPWHVSSRTSRTRPRRCTAQPLLLAVRGRKR